ncbi:hypothetical protein HUJ05_010259 [Dendroctonus ponderosae]|nr:hypothetical protein HUJ05_010259 [Dendroctonus ponderosae]
MEEDCGSRKTGESDKRSKFSFKSIKTSNHQPFIPNNQASIPSSRHKRHADIMVPKPSSIDRKPRTLRSIGTSVVSSKFKCSMESGRQQHEQQHRDKERLERERQELDIAAPLRRRRKESLYQLIVADYIRQND